MCFHERTLLAFFAKPKWLQKKSATKGVYLLIVFDIPSSNLKQNIAGSSVSTMTAFVGVSLLWGFCLFVCFLHQSCTLRSSSSSHREKLVHAHYFKVKEYLQQLCRFIDDRWLCLVRTPGAFSDMEEACPSFALSCESNRFKGAGNILLTIKSESTFSLHMSFKWAV